MHTKTATEIATGFKKGEFTAEKVASAFLERIEKLDDKVGAFLAVFKERALQKAHELDKKRAAGKPLGKLAAVPVALKDNLHLKNELTTCGSKFLSNFKAPYNATVTELLEEEDAIILGKTNLDEFAMGSSTEHSAFKNTQNPWNLSCVPGGSSGGSSAAVAARFCPLALGSDTGGSIRQPAALCGVAGFKPSYGRVSRYGLVAFASSLDQIGPFATNIQDIAAVMEVLGKNDPKDATSLIHHTEEYQALLDGSMKGKRIGIPWNFLQDLGPEAKENFDASVEILKGLGATLVDVDLSVLKHSVATYYIIATAEASTNLARFDGVRYGVRSKEAQTLREIYEFSRSEGFGEEVKNRILLGTYVLSSGFQDAFYKKAAKVRVKMIDAFLKAFQKCDVIATPTSPIPCFPIGAIRDPLEMYLQDTYTIGANLARLPAISVPSGFNKEKKPWGLHLVGAYKEDPLVCKMAHAFEQAAPYGKEIPQGFE